MDPQTAAYLAADHGGNLITLCSVLIGLSTAAALLRVWSRALLLRNRFQLDDYVALIAWVSTHMRAPKMRFTMLLTQSPL